VIRGPKDLTIEWYPFRVITIGLAHLDYDAPLLFPTIVMSRGFEVHAIPKPKITGVIPLPEVPLRGKSVVFLTAIPVCFRLSASHLRRFSTAP